MLGLDENAGAVWRRAIHSAQLPGASGEEHRDRGVLVVAGLRGAAESQHGEPHPKRGCGGAGLGQTAAFQFGCAVRRAWCSRRVNKRISCVPLIGLDDVVVELRATVGDEVFAPLEECLPVIERPVALLRPELLGMTSVSDACRSLRAVPRKCVRIRRLPSQMPVWPRLAGHEQHPSGGCHATAPSRGPGITGSAVRLRDARRSGSIRNTTRLTLASHPDAACYHEEGSVCQATTRP